jgi:hypothetical protein
MTGHRRRFEMQFCRIAEKPATRIAAFSDCLRAIKRPLPGERARAANATK